MATAALKQYIGSSSVDETVVMNPFLTKQFFDAMKESRRKPSTIQSYRRSLEALYDFLPPNKEISGEILQEWRDDLKKAGYSENTIHARLSAANVFLRFCDRGELAATCAKVVPDESLPMMTRGEYMQFLSVAREYGKEREYFLIKVFACIDLGITELDHLTVEACKAGVICLPDRREILLPDCFREELLEYASRQGIGSGRIFVTKEKNSLNRSNITKALRKLAEKAGMEPEKCNPRALHRVYLATQEELNARLQSYYLRFYDNLLKTEQEAVAWETG